MQEGYRRKLDNKKAAAVDNWRRTRLIAYLIARDSLKDKNMSMYDFYPLPGDPTKEQIEQERKLQEEKDSTWMKSVINLFRSKKLK